jgi:hypothetical protein
MAALSPESAIRKLLIDDATVAALVSTRIYPEGGAPQTPPLPFIVTKRISRSHFHHMGAAGGLAIARVQVTSYAKSEGEVETLADAIREALDGYRGTVTNTDSLTIKMLHLDNDLDTMILPWGGLNRGYPAIVQDYKVGHAESVPTF